jgi:hypothetical protein
LIGLNRPLTAKTPVSSPVGSAKIHDILRRESSFEAPGRRSGVDSAFVFRDLSQTRNEWFGPSESNRDAVHKPSMQSSRHLMSARPSRHHFAWRVRPVRFRIEMGQQPTSAGMEMQSAMSNSFDVSGTVAAVKRNDPQLS